jgi:succinate dehydrogenase/fumarate reductase flavoprotein subunit
MRQMKQDERERQASKEEIERAMADFVKESEDMKETQGTGLRLKRPPKTVKETIETLQEADKRYEAAKVHLYGSPEAES